MRKTILLSVVLFPSALYAFNYFTDHIDYWNKPKPVEVEKNPQVVEKKPQPSTSAPPAKFDWSKYNDPKNEEFLKEGEHTPPAPFMELMRNPSEENMKNWFALIQAKNELMARLQSSMATYLKTNQPPLKEDEKAVLQQSTQSLTPSVVDVQRFRFRLYFESTCPHCKDMIETLKELQALGSYTEVRQIDQVKAQPSLPFPVVQASQKELTDKKIASWPVLFIGDSKKQLVYRINGYFPTQQILSILATK